MTTNTPAPAATEDDAALPESLRTRPWSAFMPCRDRETCEHKYHVASARKKFREAIARDLYGFAEAMHDARCDMWAQGNHGGRYAEQAVAACGPDRHIAHIANVPWVRHLYDLHHKPDQHEPTRNGSRATR